MLLARFLLLAVAIVNNQWHTSRLSMLLHIAVIWSFLVITGEGPWAPDKTMFPLTVSVWGGCMYLFATLHSLPYLWAIGYRGWCVLELAHALAFLVSLKRAHNFTHVEDTYLLAAFSNVLMQIILSYSLTGYWWEYGWWCLLFLLSIPTHRHLNFSTSSVVTAPRRYLIHTEHLRHPNLLCSTTPYCIEHYSDGSKKEMW